MYSVRSHTEPEAIEASGCGSPSPWAWAPGSATLAS